jgi:hypothetical protein
MRSPATETKRVVTRSQSETQRAVSDTDMGSPEEEGATQGRRRGVDSRGGRARSGSDREDENDDTLTDPPTDIEDRIEEERRKSERLLVDIAEARRWKREAVELCIIKLEVEEARSVELNPSVRSSSHSVPET